MREALANMIHSIGLYQFLYTLPSIEVLPQKPSQQTPESRQNHNQARAGEYVYNVCCPFWRVPRLLPSEIPASYVRKLAILVEHGGIRSNV